MHGRAGCAVGRFCQGSCWGGDGKADPVGVADIGKPVLSTVEPLISEDDKRPEIDAALVNLVQARALDTLTAHHHSYLQ
jgi:hypothetical protein